MDDMTRLVLDTDVLLTGLQSSNGASRLLLCGLAEGAFTALVTVSMAIEHEAVLKRDEKLAATGMTLGDVDEFLHEYLGRAEFVLVPRRVRPVIQDPNDEILVEALAHGRGDAIVSFNRTDFLVADQRLASAGVMGAPVINPGEALRRMPWRPTATTPFGFPRP